jgi:uncharacterized protein involved in exopolysaccharide biosynthesis
MSAVPDDEVDFGRYWAALVARWWLLVAGLVLGAFIGVLVASGSKQVTRASITVFLGQPLSANGSAPIQTLGTNPSTVRSVINSPDAIAKAASAVGVDAKAFSAGIASQPVAGYLAKLGQTPLLTISVTGDLPGPKLRVVVTSLAQSALAVVSGYVDAKIATFQEQIQQDGVEIASIDARVEQVAAEVRGKSLSSTDKLVLLNLQALAEQRRTNVVSDQLQAKQLLAQAQTVEQGHVVGAATAARTTARSRSNAVAIGALIGLILASIAALVWSRRRPS